MSQNKHKHHKPYFGHTQNQGQKSFEEKENEEKIINENEQKEEIKTFSDAPKDENDDLSPPQDLNLKLQIEKENSIALTNMLKTLQADFENYRKRNANLKKESYEDGINTAIKRMLNCYDAVCNALKTITDLEVRKGLEMVEREFLNAFADFGITPIKAEGEMFDANFHNAIASEQKEGEPSGKVLVEIQKGFKTETKVIRYSLVIISK